MSRYSISEFVQKTEQQDLNQGLFELESDRILEINLNGMIWIKKGAMIAYRGDMKFTREGILEHGIGKLLKKTFTGEGTQLTKVEGRGKLYLADSAKKITVLKLDPNMPICVNGNSVLTFESSVKWDLQLMKRIAGILSGGFFNMNFSGEGHIAITSHFDPMTLIVKPGSPVYTDPNATVAWSANLKPELKTDISVKTFFGRGSGESLQMRFDGDGFVIVQPMEEVYYVSSGG